MRDILRLFSPGNTYKKQLSVFNAHSKADIVQTLVSLGDSQTNWNDYVKPACIKALIYRIQNLLPEECGICKETYVVKKTDPHILSCSICHQEVHHKCFSPLLQNNGNIDDGNIFNIPGFHYLCISCEDDVIPEDDRGLKKQKRNATAATGDNSEEMRLTGVDTAHNSNPVLSNNKNSIKSFSHEDKQNVKQKQKHLHINPNVVVLGVGELEDEDKPAPLPEKKTCKHYINNNCEHGMKGKGCKFLHPKRCTKLMNYGTKTDKGCNLGKKCPNFHPKMCSMSISKGECFDIRCGHCHVKGTVRKKAPAEGGKKGSSDVSTKHAPPAANSSVKDTIDSSASDQSFLDQICLLKKEIQEAVDLKISAMLQPPQAYVQKSCQPNPVLGPPMPQWQQPHQPQMQLQQMMYPPTFQQMQYPPMWYQPHFQAPVPQVFQPQVRMV